MAFDGGFSLPRVPDKSPVSIDLWVEGEALCAQVVEGLWFDKDLVAGAPEGSTADEDGIWRVPLGHQAYQTMVFLGLIRACYPNTFQLRGMRGVLSDWRAHRLAMQ